MTMWLRRHKDWLKDEKPKPDTPPEDDGQYGVPYIPLRCPRCKSKNIRCYVSRPPVRYHVCRRCGLHFKSVEAG